MQHSITSNGFCPLALLWFSKNNQHHSFKYQPMLVDTGTDIGARIANRLTPILTPGPHGRLTRLQWLPRNCSSYALILALELPADWYQYWHRDLVATHEIAVATMTHRHLRKVAVVVETPQTPPRGYSGCLDQ